MSLLSNALLPELYRRSVPNLPGGKFVGKNLSVKRIVIEAHGSSDFQLSGRPGWIDYSLRKAVMFRIQLSSDEGSGNF